ncbi:MAG: hypothetical protein ACLQU1_04440 [Bryobacteraceae bacterium]
MPDKRIWFRLRLHSSATAQPAQERAIDGLYSKIAELERRTPPAA